MAFEQSASHCASLCRPFFQLACGLWHWLALNFDDVDLDANEDEGEDEVGPGRGCGLGGTGV